MLAGLYDAIIIPNGAVCSVPHIVPVFSCCDMSDAMFSSAECQIDAILRITGHQNNFGFTTVYADGIDVSDLFNHFVRKEHIRRYSPSL